MIELIAILLVVLLVCFFIASMVYLKLGIGKWFYHDILEWHMPDNTGVYRYDGLNLKTICRHCRKKIMQDSQGNWFLSGGKYTMEDIKAMGYISAEDYLRNHIKNTASKEYTYGEIDFKYNNSDE